MVGTEVGVSVASLCFFSGVGVPVPKIACSAITVLVKLKDSDLSGIAREIIESARGIPRPGPAPPQRRQWTALKASPLPTPTVSARTRNPIPGRKAAR